MKKIKRLIIILITVISGYVGLWSPAEEARANPLILGLLAAAPEVDAASTVFPPLIILGASLTLCSLVYAYKDQIGTEGMRFNNWLSQKGEDISDWYNASNNSITVNDHFKQDANDFVNSEKQVQSSPQVNSVTATSSSSSVARYHDYDLDSYPDGTYSLDMSKYPNFTLCFATSSGSVNTQANCSSADGVISFKITHDSQGAIMSNLPHFGDNYASVIRHISLVDGNNNVADYPSSLPLTRTDIVYNPSSVVSGASPVAVPNGTVFKPTPTTTVGSIVGATPSSLVQTGAISTPATPSNPTPPTSGSTSDFTGIFGWLAAILAAIQLIPTVIQSLVSLVTNLPSEIKGFIDNVISSIQAIPSNLQAMFQSIVSAINGLSIPNPISAIQSIPSSISGFFDNVVSAINSVPTTVSKFIDNVISAIQAIPSSISGFFSNVVSAVGSVCGAIEKEAIDFTLPSSVSIDLTPFYVDGKLFENKFPFCLPWDLYNNIKSLSATSEAPKFSHQLDKKYFIGGGDISLDFSSLENLALVARWGETVFFTFSLILLTRKIIGD